MNEPKVFCEFTCMGCEKKGPGHFAGHHWHKPQSWYERVDGDGVQLACSRECIKTIAARTGKTDLVLPF